jgi:NAD(P)H-nitrite reductase large subunit
MITFDKWYGLVQPTHTATQLAFDKAVEKVQEEYRYAVAANKLELKTLEVELELYDKKARQNTIELGSFENRRRFQIFV